MIYGNLYFYTSSIHNHRCLIRQYGFYENILDSLNYLYKKQCIRVYGFVIMPNHMHLLWQPLQPNGKESPAASLMKFTAHQFEACLRTNHAEDLINYEVSWRSRKYNFWQPEPYWFHLWQQKTTEQKLHYIHNNPLQEKWMLVNDPVNYLWSSAKFYETGIKSFSFLEDYRDFY